MASFSPNEESKFLASDILNYSHYLKMRFLKVLLKCNLHNMQLTYFNEIVQCLLVS